MDNTKELEEFIKILGHNPDDFHQQIKVSNQLNDSSENKKKHLLNTILNHGVKINKRNEFINRNLEIKKEINKEVNSIIFNFIKYLDEPFEKEKAFFQFSFSLNHNEVSKKILKKQLTDKLKLITLGYESEIMIDTNTIFISPPEKSIEDSKTDFNF